MIKASWASHRRPFLFSVAVFLFCTFITVFGSDNQPAFHRLHPAFEDSIGAQVVPVLLASQDSGDSEAIRGQSTPTFDSGEAVGGIEEIVRSWPALSTNGVNNDNLRRDVTGSDDITPLSYTHTRALKDLDRAAWGPKGKEYHRIDKQQIKDDLEDSLGDHEVVSAQEINGGLSLIPSAESCTCLSCAYQSPWDGRNSGEKTKSARGVHVKFTGEFGYELLAVLPYAYFHFLQGSLRSSESCGDPSVAKLYYFSPNHTHNESCVRDDFQNLIKEFGWRSGLHGSPIPATWFPPPYASHFREVGKVWHALPGNKPLVIISNKFSNEWDSGPINFIDIKSLKNLLAVFIHGGYHVVYNRPGKDLQEDAWQSVDNSTIKVVLEDYQVVKKLQQRVDYKGKLVLMQDIHRANSQFSFNEVQWRMMARSKCFISVQGGNSILASYFGGKNIIFARRGFELDNKSFKRIYPSLASTEIHIARTYALLEQAARNLVRRASCHSI